MARNDLTSLGGEINALLGRGTSYEGKLTFEGRVRIDGSFRGEIFSEGVLILGEGAEVDATVDVGTLIVRGGELRGTVRARQLVEIHVPGRVLADVETSQIFIDKGVVFEGRCTMVGDDPQQHTLGGTEPHDAVTAPIGAAGGLTAEAVEAATTPLSAPEPGASAGSEDDSLTHEASEADAPEADASTDSPGDDVAADDVAADDVTADDVAAVPKGAAPNPVAPARHDPVRHDPARHDDAATAEPGADVSQEKPR